MEGNLENQLKKLKPNDVVLLKCEFPLCFASEDSGRFVYHHWDIVGYIDRNMKKKEQLKLRSDYHYEKIPGGSNVPVKPFVINYSDVSSVEVLKRKK